MVLARTELRNTRGGPGLRMKMLSLGLDMLILRCQWKIQVEGLWKQWICGSEGIDLRIVDMPMVTRPWE